MGAFLYLKTSRAVKCRKLNIVYERSELRLKMSNRVIILIHATRVGGDKPLVKLIIKIIEISIHATRVGGDIPDPFKLIIVDEFQSTPPVWVATLA